MCRGVWGWVTVMGQPQEMASEISQGAWSGERGCAAPGVLQAGAGETLGPLWGWGVGRGGLPRLGAHSIAQQRDLRDAHAVSPSASCWYPSPMLTTALSSGLPTGVLSLSFISRYPLILYLQRP